VLLATPQGLFGGGGVGGLPFPCEFAEDLLHCGFFGGLGGVLGVCFGCVESVCGDDAVGAYGDDELFDVVRDDVVAVLHPCPCLCHASEA